MSAAPDEFSTVAPVRAWHRVSPCATSPHFEWFPERWETRPSAEVALMCVRCPFNVECLDDALKFPDTEGVRGGMTKYQRRQLLADRNRMCCPGCLSDAVIAQGRGQVCISCGTSWLA